MTILLLGLIIFLLVYKIDNNIMNNQLSTSEISRVEFSTSDGVKIVGDYYSVSDANAPAVLLLHMMPSDKKSWASFAQKLQADGFQVLAIDLRGHGESTRKFKSSNGKGESDYEKLDYKNFGDSEHQKSILDIKAAVEFLKSKGYAQLFLGGASIGANLALQYLKESPDAEKAILFSAGLNYRGIETVPLARQLKATQSVFAVAAKDDNRSGGPAESMAQEIYSALTSKKEIKIFDTGGHGTDLLDAHPEFIDELINWLK